eukprot:g1043.t2
MAQENALKYSLNSEGKKVIPSSTRADGSIRPERRIREGYTPQDEQPIYKTKAALVRRGHQQCPGSDFIDTQKTGQSKSAKKRERKKQRAKEVEKSVTDPVEDVTKKVSTVHCSTCDGSVQVAEVEISKSREGGTVADEKQIRTLRKKLKQCDALLRRQEEGDVLTEQELEKLAKQQGWLSELNEIEQTLQSAL